ncbi:hypothetical protein FRC08_002173 [Ceratobasidium sp. 394]|nr:hypothetical protein FRC08_002173 [Ceratobasidium sp. 394]
MATTPPRRYRLMREGEDPNQVPWLERFDTWANRQRAHPAWVLQEYPEPPRWHATLRLNGHNVPNYVGRGDTVKNAKANLVRQLETADPPILTTPLLPVFHTPN